MTCQRSDEGAAVEYVTFDYEPDRGNEVDGYWHVYSLDQEPEGLDLDSTIFTLRAPASSEMREAIEMVAAAIDKAVRIAAAHLSQ